MKIKIRKTIETCEGLKLAIVDVLDRNRSAPNPSAYSVTREGSSEFEYRHKKKLPANPGESPAGGVSKFASDSERLNKTIPKEFEVVNIRFADERPDGIMKGSKGMSEQKNMDFAAKDEEIWRTTNKGKHYQVDTETKEVTKGNIGTTHVERSSKSEVLPSFEEFASRPEYKGKTRPRQVFDYMMEHYVRGIKSITNPSGYPEGAEIVFRRESAKKTSNEMNDDKIKALPFISEVYKTGRLVGSKEDTKNHLSKDNFIYTEKYIKEIGLKIMVCTAKVATSTKDFEYRHYLISKADKANDKKARGFEGGFGSQSRPDASKPLTYSSIITTDSMNGNNLYEFIGFTVEKVPRKPDKQINTMNKPNQSPKRALSFDASSKRRIDDNGFLHVESSHITKEQVAPYYGWEIPDNEHFGLDPKKIYYGYRSAEELEKAVNTFNGLPLLLHHHPESAEDPQKEYRVGSVGTSAVWNAPYIDNALSITDKVGIKAVQDGVCRQISSAYQYDPDFTKGEFDGQPYDFIMRNIRGNHVALVEEGRAGPDVVVADSQINPKPKGKKSVMLKLKNLFKGAWDNDPELEKDDIPAEDENKVVKVKTIIESLSDVIPKDKLEELNAALDELAEPVADDEDIPEKDKPSLLADEPEADDEDIPEMAKAKRDKDPLDDADDEDVPEEDPDDAPIDPADSIKDADPTLDKDEDEDMGDDEAPEEPEVNKEPDPEAFIKANSAADDAWEKCGIDSDDPNVKSAFAKGYEYGAKRQAMAQDSAIHRVVKGLEAKYEAAAEVGKYIGAIKPMAFDSVPDIYAHALREMGVSSTAFSKRSARDVFRIIVKQREVQIAQDAGLSRSTKYSGKFAGLNNIK